MTADSIKRVENYRSLSQGTNERQQQQANPPGRELKTTMTVDSMKRVENYRSLSQGSNYRQQAAAIKGNK